MLALPLATGRVLRQAALMVGLAGAVVLIMASGASAQPTGFCDPTDHEFVAEIDNNLGNPDNWSESRLPNAGEVACVSDFGFTNVFLEKSVELTVNGLRSAETVVVTDDAHLVIGPDADDAAESLITGSLFIDGNGHVTIGHAGSGDSLAIDDTLGLDGGTLDGAGAVTVGVELDWLGGRIGQAGDEGRLVAGNATCPQSNWEGDGDRVIGWDTTLQTAINWSGAGNLDFDSPALTSVVIDVECPMQIVGGVTTSASHQSSGFDFAVGAPLLIDHNATSSFKSSLITRDAFIVRSGTHEILGQRNPGAFHDGPVTVEDGAALTVGLLAGRALSFNDTLTVAGDMHVRGGQIFINGGGTIFDGAVLVCEDDVVNLQFSGDDFAVGGTVTGNGPVTVTGGITMTVTGTWDMVGPARGDTTVNGALTVLDFTDVDAATDVLFQTGGVIRGTGQLSVGRLQMTGGTHDGGGRTLLIGGQAGTSFLNGTVDNREVLVEGDTADIKDVTLSGDAVLRGAYGGNLLVDEPVLRLNNSNVVAGASGGQIVVGADSALVERFSFAGITTIEVPVTVEETGSFTPRGQFLLDNTLETSGLLEIPNSGGNPDNALTVTGGIEQLGGTALLNEVSPDPVVILGDPAGSELWNGAAGARVEGAGTIDGRFALRGTLVPGNSPGVLTVTRNFHAHASSTIEIEIDGPTPGIDFDQIISTGPSGQGEILGTIEVTVEPDYIPANGQQFLIIDGNGFEEVSATLVDLDPDDNKDFTLSTGNDDVILTAATEADLSVDTTITGTELTGQTLIFDIQVDNAGPLQATNPFITNQLPPNVSLTSASPGCIYEPAPVNEVTCHLNDLDPGDQDQVTLTGQVTGPGTTDNVTTATSDQGDPDGATDTDTITVEPTADLEVAGFASTPSPDVGDPVSKTAFISNDGPDDATNVTVTFTLPNGYDVPNPPVGCSFGGSDFAQTYAQASANTTIECRNISIDSGGLETITIDGTATAVGTQVTTVDASTPDFTDDNGAATTIQFTAQEQSDTGNGDADLGVDTTLTPATGAQTGDAVTVDITVTSDAGSPDPSSNTVVENQLPANTRLATIDTGNCGYSPGTNTVTCDVDNLEPGDSATISLTATITGPGTADNTTTVAADQADANPDNDTDVDTLFVTASADLGVTAFVSDATPTVGDDVTITALAANDGPDPAEDATLSLTIPTGYAVDPLPQDCVTETGAVIDCAVGTLAAGSSTVLQVTGTATAVGQRTVGVTATSSTDDPDPEDNAANVTFTTAAQSTSDGSGGPDAPVGSAGEVTVSLVDVMVEEGDEGTTTLEITAELSRAVGFDVTVTVDVTDLTSSIGRDFVLPTSFAQLDQILTIKGGDTTGSLLVEIVGDSTPEPDEQFTVAIIDVDPPAVEIGQDTATVTITDDDEAEDPFTLEPATFSDTCLIDPQGLGLQPKSAKTVSNADMALGLLGCSDLPSGGTVVLSRDDDFADSLASGVLQGDSPLMLVPSSGQIPALTLERLDSINPEDVVIVGGESAVAPEIEDQLTARGIAVSRRRGATRLETAVDIAATDAPQATTAIIARAFPNPDATDPTQAFADAIAAGGMAADLGFPVLLTQTEQLSDSTATYLQQSAITDVFIMGGTAAISAEVERSLEAMLTGDVQRVTGSTRFGTAIAAAAIRGAGSAADATDLILLEGQDDDAWAAGFTAAYPSARMDAPIVLVNGEEVPPATAEFLSANAESQFAVTTDPAPGEQPLTCAATDDACFTARRLLGLTGVEVTFLPRPLGLAVPGRRIDVSLDRPLPADADLVVAGSCLRDPVTDLAEVRIRTDLPPLPCTVEVTITYANGTVQRATSAYTSTG